MKLELLCLQKYSSAFPSSAIPNIVDISLGQYEVRGKPAKKQSLELFEACRRGDIEKVKNYIASKRSKKARTPLKILVESDRLLTSARDKRGCVPLHLASWNGHFEAMKLLVEFDTDSVDAVNNAQESPLHLAAQHGHDKVVRVLLEVCIAFVNFGIFDSYLILNLIYSTFIHLYDIHVLKLC
uniref:ANK_REP_REGION domain-containing protein n=1 Tax=Angiostrongylus cantonensis TaxID=6313 RepID=A0A0K0D7L5_ANGCA